MTSSLLPDGGGQSPVRFTRDDLPWLPWLEPVAEADLTDVQKTALVDKARVRSDYFRLLARAPAILEARTKTARDIFHNDAGGLPRAERELAATATSRVNGCIYCASVHARFAAHYSRRPGDIDRLLAQGPDADLGERWNALVAAAKAITATPSRFGAAEVTRLRKAGLDEGAIADLIQSAAFFNWANRLMLSLGGPVTSHPAPVSIPSDAPAIASGRPL
ncbi:MAG: alkylhydroperoxidase domain protein [Telmatospirillum sp.]|nr:alkylhydroperoxidase domain protein [Telmatospirillum sp.]